MAWAAVKSAGCSYKGAGLLPSTRSRSDIELGAPESGFYQYGCATATLQGCFIACQGVGTNGLRTVSQHAFATQNGSGRH